jgi:signal peptidase I
MSSEQDGNASDVNANTGDDDFKEYSEDEQRALNTNNPLLRGWLSLPIENREDIKTTAVSFFFALLVRCFIVEPRFIPSLSMFPTFEVGDQLLVDKISKLGRPFQRHDVVVFNPSDTYIELTGNTEALIKRVVGVAGDTIEVQNEHLFVNGVQQEEPYINENPNYRLEKLVVPTGMVLVLGDNRNHSYDSHVWGFLPQERVIGRAVFRYWPPWRVGTIEGTP